MKKTLSLLSLAALTIGLLGSCSKINERIDGLDKRINSLENDKIASVEQQIAAINQSIADLGTIRTNIQTLIEAKTAQGEDITKLKEADQALEGKIAELKTYLDTNLAKYATTEWVNATFATLEKQAEIITDVTKLKQDLAGLDAALDQNIEDLDSSLKVWVNEQLSAYSTTAQMEAKIKALQDQIDALKADNETNKSDIEDLEADLAQLEQDLESAKATIKTAYEKAIKDALESNNGYITEKIKRAISSANGSISSLSSRVGTLETQVGALRGDVDALKGMIQSVTIIPAYSDGSVEADENGELTINCIIRPASAVTGLSEDNFTVLLNEVKTKAGAYESLNVSTYEKTNESTGEVKITAKISGHVTVGKALMTAVKVKDENSEYVTGFVPVTRKGTIVLAASSVQDANAFIAQSDDCQSKTIDLSSATITQQDVNEKDHTIHFILKKTSPEDLVSFELPAIPEGINCEGWTIEYEEKYPTKNVDVNAPNGTKVTILAPTSHVTVTGTNYAEITALTGDNTLVIPNGVKVDKLIAKKGAFEIHGTVSELVISPEGDYNVCFRDCEGLIQSVFDVIKGSTPSSYNYIDTPSYAEKKNADGTWDITYTCKIGNKTYGTIEDAFNNVKNGETIVMHQNDVLTKGLTITLGNNEAFTLDLNGKTVSIAETGFDFTANRTNSALRNGVPVRFAVVVTGQGTMNICDNSADKLGCFETKDYSYGSTKTILVDGNAVVNVNSGTIASDYASFYVVGYTATGAVPANAPKPTLNVNGGKILSELVGIGIKGNTATLKVTGGEIIGKGYYGISTNGTTDWYDGGKFAIEITGGSIKSEEGAAMYLPAEGPTVISGGKIEGAEGIAVKGGSLSISGDAVIKSHGAYGEPSAANSGYTQTGSCIYVEDTYPDHSPIVSISGGKFSSDNNKAVEYYTNKADDATNKGKVSLSGGLYSDEPDASLIAVNYEAVSNSDATYKYKVQQKPPVVKIGGVEYATLADAFAAVPTDGTPTTVTLLENIGSKVGDDIVWKEYAREFAYTVNANQNITFDLNGKKIYAKTTVNGYTGFLLVKNGGSLTIKDSAGGGELNYLDGNDNNGGLAISSEGNLTIQSGTIENHTNCNASAIQGAIDVHANEWGTPYASHVTFKMDGGVLKSQNDNTLRIYDSSQTGKGTVVFDFEINGGEIYGADAVFIMTQWTKTYCTGDTYMNNINASVKGGKFVTKNGIRVVGNVGEDNNKDYRAIKINVSGGDFTILSSKESKHRVNNVAFQESAGWTSTEESTKHLRSYTEVTWTANAPSYSE